MLRLLPSRLMRARIIVGRAPGFCAVPQARPAARVSETVGDAADVAVEEAATPKPLRRITKLADAPAADVQEKAAPKKAARSTPAAKQAEKPELDKRDEQMQLTMAKINKRFGAGTMTAFGQRQSFPEMERFSTGVLTLDQALGGGIPRGRIIEIYGPESSGKTSLALCIMAEAQKDGHLVGMVDAEHAFDHTYAQKIGLDTNNGFYFSTPDTGEVAFEVVDELCRTGQMGVVLVDSVSALIPRVEMDRDMGDPQVGSQARLMSNGLRRIAQSAARHNTTVIFINQLRMKIGVMYGNPETTSGGIALKFYASQRIDVRKKQFLDGVKDGPAAGIKIKAKVVKNKVGPPAGVVLFDLIYDKGIDKTGALLDAAVLIAAVDRRGAYFFFVHDGEEVRLGQGRDAALEFLDDEANEAVRGTMEEVTRERLTPASVAAVAAAPAADDDAAIASEFV